MNKENKNKGKKLNKVDNLIQNQDHEDYGYDFVPTLNEWVNIDEQRQRTKELEDI